MERLDRPLDRLLAGLAGVLAASREDRIRVRLGDWPDATADCLDLLRDALALIGGELRDHDCRALARETLRVGLADALARSRDDRNLVLEPHVRPLLERLR